MLTLRTSAHIPTGWHRRGLRLISTSTGVLRVRAGTRRRRSLRLILTSTGAPRARADGRRLFPESTRLLDAGRRRLWLNDRWSAHVGRIQARPWRRQS
jgi:hypothetical protein